MACSHDQGPLFDSSSEDEEVHVDLSVEFRKSFRGSIRVCTKIGGRRYKRPRKVVRRKSDVMGEYIGMAGLFLRRMISLGIPAWFFMVVKTLHERFDLDEQYDCIEWYAGVSTIQRAFKAHGMAAAAFDKENNPEGQNFLTALGFVHAIILSLRLKPRGLNFWATVCSTWVSLCRNSTYRTDWRPLGNKSASCIKDANLQVTRMVLLIRVCAAKYSRFGLEQPASSIMEKHPRMVQLAKAPAALLNGPFTKIHTHMAGFGKNCEKPTHIYGSGAWVSKLERPVPPGFKATLSTTNVPYGRHLLGEIPCCHTA